MNHQFTSMKTYDLKERFMAFAVNAAKATEHFPNKKLYWIVTDQLIRCSSSSASNHRAAKRAKSSRDFINKLKIVEEELDETMFWTEYTMRVNDQLSALLLPIENEADELLAITVQSIKTARQNALLQLKSGSQKMKDRK